MKLIKKTLLIVFGYVLFSLVVAGLESIIVTNLGMNNYIVNNLKENIQYTLAIYIGLNFLFWGINYIYNLQTVEHLNSLLDIINEKKAKNAEHIIETEK